MTKAGTSGVVTPRESERLSGLLAALYYVARREYGSDLTHRAIRVLQFIARHETAPRIDDVARHLGSAASTTSELVKRLATRGLVSRRRCEDDERVVRLALTAAGSTALREHTTLDPEKLARGLAALDGAERGELMRLLAAVGERLEGEA